VSALATASDVDVEVPLRTRLDCLSAGKTALRLAERFAWPAEPAAELQLVVVELAMNAVRHGRGGKCRLSFGVDADARVLVWDDGPGFPDPVLADRGRTDGMCDEGMRDPLRRRPGLGSGLACARRLSDELILENGRWRGARATAFKRRASTSPKRRP
jgi:anti-sigma regulatory factor (Ser/Thr protein kinase)